MPYDNEHASPLGHVPIMARERETAGAMQRWQRIVDSPSDIDYRHFLHDAPDIAPDAVANLSICVDGSPALVKDMGSVLAFYQIGTAMIDVELYLGAAGTRAQTVDRSAMHKSVSRSQIVLELPCAGYVPLGDDGDEADLWRSEVFRQFQDRAVQVTPDLRLSLLDGLMLLHGGPRTPARSVIVPRCPNCPARDIDVPVDGRNCECGSHLYPTDILRSIEDFVPGENANSALGRVGAAAERLLMVLYIEGLFRSSPNSMGKVFLVTDGPLAFFGPTAPTKTAFLSYWWQLSLMARTNGFNMPVLVGVDKTGTWVELARALRMAPGQFFLPDNSFIAKYLKRRARHGTKTYGYGADEYYGRHVVYQSRHNGRFVLTVMRASGAPYTHDDDPSASDPKNYPSLGQALHAVDRLASSTFEGGLVPVVEAHQAAAIPTAKAPLLHEMVHRLTKAAGIGTTDD